MTSTKRFEISSVVSNRADAAGLLTKPGDAVLVERGVPRWLLISCPCGCGDEIPVNLDSRAGPAWDLYRRGSPSVATLYPSVWRDTGCESHFIIWRGQLMLFGANGDGDDSGVHIEGFASLAELVAEALPRAGFESVRAIADRLDELPWDVLRACRYLVRENRATEGRGHHRGAFGRLDS